MIGVLVVALSACAGHAPQNIFKPKGSRANSINHLQVPVFWIAAAVGILVFAAVAYVMVRYREKPGEEDRVPPQLHGNTKLEVGWTILPALLLVGVAVPTVNTVIRLADTPKDRIDIDVIGQQWWWEYQYRGTNVVTANEMVIPVGKPVLLHITSRDVIHSYWIPALNGKKDAVPGRTSPLVFEADKPGEFWGQCTEFCGLSHANMRERVVALSQADYDTWLTNQQKDAVTPTDPTAKAGMTLFENRGCAACHQIRGVSNPTDVQLVSGAAPNLTHLMSRTTFAGATFDLKTPDCQAKNDMPTGTPQSCVNQGALDNWLKNPSAVKPMDPNNKRGMPNLNLSQTEISQLIAYLSTLK